MIFNFIILQVSLGWGHALALTKDGKLFGWGYYADGRLGKIGNLSEASPLDSISGRVKSSCENSNSMIEAAEKLVLEAIEKETDMPIIWQPTLIEELCDVKVVDVACGLDHSLVLCSKSLPSSLCLFIYVTIIGLISFSFQVMVLF